MRSGSSILVVDDDQDLLNLLERIPKEEGYQVRKAYDGCSAIAFLEEQKPDLIILDIIMPDPDGLEVLNFARQHYEIPVIMLTARRDVGTLRDALISGADDYVRKPFDKLELIARIRAKLRHIYY